MTDPTQTAVTLVNVLSVDPEKQKKLVALLRENTETVIKTLKGWLSTDLIVSVDGASVVIYSRWETAGDVAAMRTDPRMLGYFPKIAALASLSSFVGEVVMSHHR